MYAFYKIISGVQSMINLQLNFFQGRNNDLTTRSLVHLIDPHKYLNYIVNVHVPN